MLSPPTLDKSELARPTKYKVQEIVLTSTILGILSSVFLSFGVFVRQGAHILQTNWFVGSIVTELVFLSSIRSRVPFCQATRPPWPVLTLSTIAFTLTVLLPYTAVGQTIFHFTPPTAAHLGIILGLVGAYSVCSEIVKNVYYRKTS